MENRAIIDTTRHDTTRHDTTRHDTTRHDTTRHDTTRHDTTDYVLKVAVVGSLEGTLYVAESIGKSSNYKCSLVVAQSYPGKGFVAQFFRSGFKDKLRLVYHTAKAFRTVKGVDRSIFRKITNVYFTSLYRFPEPFKHIPKNLFDEADVFLIAYDDSDVRTNCMMSDYVIELMRLGISREKIFIVPPVMFKAELPIIEENKLSPLCKNVNNVKPVMRYMEYHVTDFCNLKCKGCGHLANYVRELEFAGADKFRLSLMKLAEKFSNIAVIRIMGGEPLLCKELHEYINAAHDVFPYSQVKIVTNGLLYKNITPLTIEAIKRSSAEIQVTQYPPTREIAGELVDFCQENGLALSVSKPVHEFFKRAAPSANVSSEKCWIACGSRYCHFLHGTSFYPCPAVWTRSEVKFSDFVKYPFSESEVEEYPYNLSHDISDDGWEILKKFDSPMKICTKCGDKKVFFKWESEAAGKQK